MASTSRESAGASTSSSPRGCRGTWLCAGASCRPAADARAAREPPLQDLVPSRHFPVVKEPWAALRQGSFCFVIPRNRGIWGGWAVADGLL